MKRSMFMLATAMMAATSGSAWSASRRTAARHGKKFKIYLSLSHSGIPGSRKPPTSAKALAATPPYNDMVELTEVISGTDPQARAISAYESNDRSRA